MIAPSCSTHPFGEPGVLQMMACPRMPAMPRESRPSGLTSRIASASPGASRSMTARVPSGVWSRGANPVPPVVTMTPANPSAQRAERLGHVVGAVGRHGVINHVEAGGRSCSTSAMPRRPGASRATTPSDTVNTLAARRGQPRMCGWWSRWGGVGVAHAGRR